MPKTNIELSVIEYHSGGYRGNHRGELHGTMRLENERFGEMGKGGGTVADCPECGATVPIPKDFVARRLVTP